MDNKKDEPVQYVIFAERFDKTNCSFQPNSRYTI